MSPPPVYLPHLEALTPRHDERTDPRTVRDDAQPAVHLAGVTVGYASKAPLVSNVDLVVRPGEVVALVGVSGAGKTSLLKTIAGVLPPLAGRVEVLGCTYPRHPPRGSLGYIPQRLGLITHASVLDNVLLGALHREPSWRSALNAHDKDTLAEARAVLERVGLAEKEETSVKALSGGQQRRVAVARALLQRPRVLLADEFLSELDRVTAAVVESAVLELAETGTAIVLVEHHVRKARRMGHRVFEMHAGFLAPLPEPPLAGAPEPEPVQVS